MAFDGTHFEPPAPPPRKPGAGETVLCVLIVALALCALILPISAAAFTDLGRYLMGHSAPAH